MFSFPSFSSLASTIRSHHEQAVALIKRRLLQLKPTRQDLKDFRFLASIQLATYFLFSVNARALAQGRIAWTFFSDLIYATVSYHLIKKVSENKSGWGLAGFILGGAWGSVLAILLTKYIFGE